MKVEWRCITNATGEQYVTEVGVSEMPTLSVDSLATHLRHRLGGAPISAGDQGRYCLTELDAMATNQASTSVTTVDGIIMDAATVRLPELLVILEPLYRVS